MGDISLAYGVRSGKLNLAITGIMLLTFMTVHLFQFRFGETQPFKLCPPPYLINLWTLMELRPNLFWVDTPGCTTAEVRDIYRLEFEVFQNPQWCAFYLAAVLIFACHTALGGASCRHGHSQGSPPEGDLHRLCHPLRHRRDLCQLPDLHPPQAHGRRCLEP